ADFAGALAIATLGSALAQWSFPAIRGNDQSPRRCGGNFRAIAACGNHAALERCVTGGRPAALPWTGLWRARDVRSGRHSEKRCSQGRFGGRLGFLNPRTHRSNPSLGFGGARRQSAAESQSQRTLEHWFGELCRGRTSRRGSEIESSRAAPRRWRKRALDGIAVGFPRDTGVGPAGLVSLVSSGRCRGSDGGAVFHRWHDSARLAAVFGIGCTFEQWW